ncbi:MAG: threonine ammonia-lyase [Andreesenia angusta]|nr:threonine ammonia-lyase [Andreesenia angusta]
MDKELYLSQVKKIDFDEAEKRLSKVIRKTRLIYSRELSEETNNYIYIKPENLQNTGSFKIRGAYNRIFKLTEEEKERGLIASSAGNHAQGVAYSANKAGVKATIVMPNTTPLIKVEATKRFGAEVILHGDCYDEAYLKARELEEEKGYVFIHPFNDPDVIEGQGTISLEILEELKDADYILAPIGGGGLISGIAIAAKRINPGIKIIGVEPEGARTLSNSMTYGEPVCLDKVYTIADGVAVKEPGDLTFEIIRDYVDEIVVVSDYEIMEAFLILLDNHKLIGENAGVASLAAVKKLDLKYKKIVSVISGGNIDVLTLSSMISRGLIARGRIFSFAVELPDRPGELVKISETLARENANVIKLEHNQLRSIDRFMEVELKVTVETNGPKHITKIIKALNKEGYEVFEA